MTISTSVNKNNKEVILVSANELEQVTCIQYPIAFPVGVILDGSALDSVLAPLNLSSEVNAMYPALTKRLGFVVQTTNIGAQKINGTTLEIYEIVVAAFSVTDQANRVKFFKETFLVANISPDVVFGMPFLTFSGADINFLKRELL